MASIRHMTMKTVNWKCSNDFSHRELKLCLINWIYISSGMHRIAEQLSNTMCWAIFDLLKKIYLIMSTLKKNQKDKKKIPTFSWPTFRRICLTVQPCEFSVYLQGNLEKIKHKGIFYSFWVDLNFLEIQYRKNDLTCSCAYGISRGLNSNLSYILKIINLKIDFQKYFLFLIL